MLHYHDPIHTKDNLTLSIDNVVLDLYISHPDARDRLMVFLDDLPIKYAVNVVYWNSFRPGTFREQFSIQMQDGTSFWLGVVLNGRKPEWGRCRLDFNPNKIAHHEVFQKLLNFLIVNTRPMHRVIKRFDLAIDIPVERFSCFLVKDGRAYMERRHGQEYTQYLGAKASTVGRVKLYNKQVESKLLRPLTRLELTLDPSIPYDEVSFPTVYYLDDLQMVFDEAKATDTERFILNALLQGFGSLHDLGRRTRDKIERLLSLYVKWIKITPHDYAAILAQLRTYITGTNHLDTLDSDQPPKPPAPPLPDWVADLEAADKDEELPL
ncbi:MAG: hypothetical protein J6D17_00475 [Bacteroides sp.]|nr:hypothetical protein [Bacteroides sp.]